MLTLFALLAACVTSTPRQEDTGSTLDAWGCIEDTRATVTDPTVPAEGMSFPVQQALWSTGDFEGSLIRTNPDGTEGESVQAILSIDPLGDAEVVTFREGSSDGGEYAALDAALDCGPRYEIPVRVTGRVGPGPSPEIETTFDVVLSVASVDSISLYGTVEEGGWTGSAAPVSFDPAEYDETWLSLSATTVDLAWTGTWDWTASKSMSEEDGMDGVSMAVMEPIGTFHLSGITR